ncbi:IS630 family transposase [Agrobacterium sp. SHOUNA12C]|uniref:IS630 family transposase n=1 Tax=Rhizobium rhizogenes TaxID=359 RepID=UPI00123AB983|nr:IS630 family transposase [Rhizobium rhizogenes]KAA6488632.1 IS630 family transposase [Agrobacterium sp. ICMP 7243]MCJ9721205.1 IS630 family transposase [Agrobacterium sp. BETTINA12B]MCJ9756234.1 IS630 family transposase [Agrobacterium sp. SHOUNA12C]NTF52248.1 IS630 family transposase [Rhizobium rhizogenes]NTG17792.1 IS630 family transposase [Rhizobium rhizogenes]
MAGTTGRPTAPLVLTEEERAYLKQQARHEEAAGRSMSERCQIILRCADGIASKAVAAELNVHENTVGKWRRRFLRDRIEGLFDADRSGRPRTIDDDQIAAVIERTLKSKPEDGSQWSIRSMAAATGFSHTTIRRIWASFGLQPHHSQTSEPSSVPPLIDKVCDVVGLHLAPPNRVLALSVDKKSHGRAHNHGQSGPSMMPNQAERHMHSHAQPDVPPLLAALDLISGFVIGNYDKRHRATELLDFLRQIDASVPFDLDVHIVMDNHATHKIAAVRSWLARHPRYHVHFTPTSASWLNQVESWFAELSRRQLQRDVRTSTNELEANIRAFVESHAESFKPYSWTKSADETRSSVKSFRLKTAQSQYRQL